MQPLQTVFRCPRCAESLTGGEGPNEISCSRCASRIPVVEGVRVLVRDLATIESSIAQARDSARAAWYDEPHANQWMGPYRHHLRKRRRYVERLLAAEPSVKQGEAVGLDLGCGDGVNMRWLQPYFRTLYGSDYNL